MSHQGLPVSGYRPQSDEAVLIVNENKRLEEETLRQIDHLRERGGLDYDWLEIGLRQIQQGWMAINRAVFQPARIRLPGDDEIGLPDFMVKRGASDAP